MPPRNKGLVPACLVLAAVVALVVWRPVPDAGDGRAPEDSPAAVDPRGRDPERSARKKPGIDRDLRMDRPDESIPIGADFIASIVAADRSSVRIPLPGGGEVGGRVTRLTGDDENPLRVEGETTRPAGGRFYFERQTAPGKAGPLVGYLHFEDRETAYRVVPDPADPQHRARWERTDVDRVVCRAFAPPPPDDPEAIPPTHPTDYPIPPDENGIIQLESLPGATAVIYLDFDGENRDFTSWGNINAAAANVSNAQIFEVWKGVCEDYQPFDLNITTIRSVFEAAPKGRRMQVVITPTNSASPGAGGVAYIGSFNWTGEVVCWSFSTSGKNAVEVISHEVGHTLGLSHDGRTSPSETYYSGADGWAPIMGVGYYQPLSQWSKGEYANANNSQDDTYIIANNNNNVSWREDDHGQELADACWLEISDGGLVDDEGFIGAADDLDSFRFVTAGGDLSLEIRNVDSNPNLDVTAEIVDAVGTVVATSGPTDSLDASFSSLPLAAGDYLLRVSGTGNGDPAGSGYSDYGSLGAYTVTGSVIAGEHADRFTLAEHSPAGSFLGIIAPRADHGSGTLSYSILSGNTGATFSINSLTGALVVSDASLLDFESLSTRWDEPAEFELFIGITDSLGVATESIRTVVTISDENEAPAIEPISAVSLLERLVPGTHVLRAVASDPDRANRLTFSIEGGNAGDAFAIDPDTGDLTTQGPLDFETNPSYVLTIRVTDDGSPARYDETPVVIGLVDIAEDIDPGSMERIFYEGISGNAVASLVAAENYPSRPDSIETLTSFDGGTGHGDEYGSVLRGYLIPPATGDYSFWLASDDWGELWISTDSDPANGVKHASVIGWTQPHEWDKYPWQESDAIPLVAGQAYFIEARHKQGGGEDHVAVAWQGPGLPNREVIPGRVLAAAGGTFAPWMPPMSLTLRESAGDGQRIAGLPFVEPDAGQGISSIEILSGNDAGAFGIHPFTRDLIVQDGSSLVAGTLHELTVRATDSGSPPMSGTAQVTIEVIGLEDDLHAWWDFEETSGSVAYDSSGNDRHAGVSGGAVFDVRDPAGGSLALDGSTGRVEYLGEDGLSGDTPFTVAAWVRIPASHAADAMLVQQREAGSSGHIGQYRVKVKADGRVNFVVYGRDSDESNEGYQFDVTSGTSIADDQWHHVACVRDGGDGLLFIDGSLAVAGSGAVRMLDPSLTVAIGFDARNEDEYLGGSVDDVRIYQDALGASQIARIAGTPRVAVIGPDSGIVGVAPGHGLYLEGFASDPVGGDPVVSWTQVDGPAPAQIETPDEATATARFPVVGSYVFRFTASDGEFEASRDMTVIAGTTAVTPVVGIDCGSSVGSHESPVAGSCVLRGPSSGIDAGGTVDGFFSVGQSFSGDFDVRVSVDAVSDVAGTADERAGLIVRSGDGTNESDASAFIGANGGGSIHRVVRGTSGATNDKVDLGFASLPCWLRVSRVGNDVLLFRSPDGETWSLEGSTTMTGDVRAGICWSSGDESADGSAEFSGLSGLCEANLAPRVNIGSMPPAGVGESIHLVGSVSDDGLPEAPGVVEVEWISTAGGVLGFDPADQVSTTAVAATDGTHFVRLVANDGEVRSFSEASVEVLPTVAVSAEPESASENGPVAGTFTLTRDGGLASDLEIWFAFAGSALEDADFVPSATGSAIIPAGSSSTMVDIVPLGDTLVEGEEFVEMIVLDGSYLHDGVSASVAIEDSNHAPVWADPVPALVAATEGTSYSGSLGIHAVDPDGDAIEFTKLAGPDWLVVGSDGSLSGVPGAADVGTGSLSIRVTDTSGSAADINLEISVQAVVLAFQDWKEFEFGVLAGNEVISGDHADPDGDSLTNLVEYALGTDPMVAGASGITADLVTINGVRCLRIHVPLDPGSTDVTVEVEVSGQPANPESWSTEETVVEVDTSSQRVVRDAVGGPRRFLRIRVTR